MNYLKLNLQQVATIILTFIVFDPYPNFSDSDPEETEFEREFIDINRRRSLRKHKENSATLSPNGLSSNKVSIAKKCSSYTFICSLLGFIAGL